MSARLPRALPGEYRERRLRRRPPHEELGSRLRGPLHALENGHADGVSLDRPCRRGFARRGPGRRGRGAGCGERDIRGRRSAGRAEKGGEPMRTDLRDSPLLLCARQELTLSVRSRWTQIFAGVFAALSLAVASSGYILSGGGGVQDFARTAASLVQLVLLLVPLTSLVIGVLALSPDRGAAELLFSQPVSRRTLLFGRLLGLFAALGAAQAVGLGGAGIAIFWRSGQVGAGAYGLLFASSLALTAGVLGLGGAGIAIFWRSGQVGTGAYGLLFASSLALTAVFLGLAAALACGAVGRKARSLALALILWFGAVGLFYVAALGAATLLPSGSASRLLIAATLVNPVDAVRTGTLLAIEGTTAFGAASLALLRATRGPGGAQALVALSVFFWIVIPVAVAARRLGKADL